MKRTLILIAIIFGLAGVFGVLYSLNQPVTSAQTLPHAEYTTAITGTVNEYIFKSDSGDWFGYFYKDGKWYAGQYDINATDFSKRYTGSTSTDFGPKLSGLKDKNFAEGSVYLAGQLQNSPGGSAYVGYTDSGGYKKLDNTTYNSNPTKYSFDSNGNIIIKSSSTRSPEPGMNTVVPSTSPVVSTSKSADNLPYIVLPNILKWSSLTDILTSLPSLLTIAGSGLFVVSFIVAGYLYLTSSGNEEQVTRAKNAILAGIIGIIIVILGQTIVNYLITFIK